MLYCCLLVIVQPPSLAWADLHNDESLWALFQRPIVEFRLGYLIFSLGTLKFPLSTNTTTQKINEKFTTNTATTKKSNKPPQQQHTKKKKNQRKIHHGKSTITTHPPPPWTETHKILKKNSHQNPPEIKPITTVKHQKSNSKPTQNSHTIVRHTTLVSPSHTMPRPC